MRARFVSSVVVMFAIGLEGAWGEEVAAPKSAQVASCPPVLPVAEGERSVVVPTVAPNVETPHVASLPLPAEHEAAKSLLKEKLAERDRLQREISALREQTKTPEQILVRVKMIEVNLTKMRKLGIDFSTSLNPKNTALKAPFSATRVDAPHGSPGTFEFSILDDGKTIGGFVDALQRRNLANVLAEPSVVTTNGQRASLAVVDECSIPAPGEVGGVKIQKYGTQLDVTATALGDNRVRLHVRPRVSELDASRKISVGGQPILALTVREVDTAVEMELSQSAVLSGLVQERKVTTTDWLGRKSDAVEEIALVVVVTPEFVR
jgi:Flp pilus assembly secretin CpaC